MILITGGSGSGKSAYGEKRILEAGEMTGIILPLWKYSGKKAGKR